MCASEEFPEQTELGTSGEDRQKSISFSLREAAYKMVIQELMKIFSQRNVDLCVCIYADRHGWGRKVTNLLSNVPGVNVDLFTSVEKINDKLNSVVYMHPDHLNNRETDKEKISQLGRLTKTEVIPSIRELILYDEKVNQALLFGKWLPKTQVFFDYDQAKISLEEKKFPFISKSSEGAGSSNIRMIYTYDEGLEELDLVFSTRGMRRYTKPSIEKRGTVNFQKGYVLWQDFLSGNDNDWRVIMIGGKYAWIIKRGNKGGSNFASGSGLCYPVEKIDGDVMQILAHSYRFVEEFDLEYTGIDLIKDESEGYKILEVTTGWPTSGSFADSAEKSVVFIRGDSGEWFPSIFTGGDLWKITSIAILEKFLKPPFDLNYMQNLNRNFWV